MAITSTMDYPKKLYVEITTRCNLKCNKCIKQAENHGIIEGDMSFDVFKRIARELTTVDHLILNGIGEPLLHPELEKMVEIASKVMPRKASIGFQSNGLLMTSGMARRLVAAGLTTICLSLDNLHHKTRHDNSEPDHLNIEKALGNLQAAAQTLNKSFHLGLEIVVSKKNINQLPKMIQWAADHGVDYILVSHLFTYDHAMAAESLFSTIPLESLSVFQQWQEKAQKMGVNLQEGLKSYLKFTKNKSDRSAIKLLKAMSKEALKSGLPLHWENLFSYDAEEMELTKTLFTQAQNLAVNRNVTLFLPPLHAQLQSSCTFIDEEAACITFLGNVTPCHFLWHTYPCMSGNDIINVHEKNFGNMRKMSLQEIWLGQEYLQFRLEAVQHEISPCWNCVQGPCEDLLNDNLLGSNDCYGNRVPCGHCRWSMGGLKCL